MRRPLLVALTAVLVGCSDPYATRPAATPSSREGEVAGGLPSEERAAVARPQVAPARTTRAALTEFAELVTNWTAGSVAERYRKAARRAVGQARRDAELTAASATTDRQMAGTESRSELVAIVDQADGWSLLVTHERLTPAALTARYRVYRAHTRAVAGGIAVDVWEPQP